MINPANQVINVETWRVNYDFLKCKSIEKINDIDKFEVILIVN